MRLGTMNRSLRGPNWTMERRIHAENPGISMEDTNMGSLNTGPRSCTNPHASPNLGTMGHMGLGSSNTRPKG